MPSYSKYACNIVTIGGPAFYATWSCTPIYIFRCTVFVTLPRAWQISISFLMIQEPCNTHKFLYDRWSTFSGRFHTVSFTMQSHDQNSTSSLKNNTKNPFHELDVNEEIRKTLNRGHGLWRTVGLSSSAWVCKIISCFNYPERKLPCLLQLQLPTVAISWIFSRPNLRRNFCLVSKISCFLGNSGLICTYPSLFVMSLSVWWRCNFELQDNIQSLKKSGLFGKLELMKTALLRLFVSSWTLKSFHTTCKVM